MGVQGRGGQVGGPGGGPGGDARGGVRGCLGGCKGMLVSRELEIVKSVDLNSKMEQIALTERRSPCINHN